MKKVISYLLLVITVMTCTVPYLIKSTEYVSAASSAWKSGTVITSAKGKDYTSNEALAGKLDNIFAGHISIYTDSACKNEKVAALGTYSVVPENKFYIGTSYYTGESCYAYANGVYYTLFNEIAGHHGSSSVEIGISTISESAFNAGGVNNAPGAYIVMGTHKQILLGYNSDSITIVDGNNDANGYVCIRKFTWSDYESLTRHYAGNSNITVIQRKDYWSIYPIDTEPPVFSSSVNAASLMCMEDGEDGFTINFDVTDNYGVTTCYANIWEYGQTENDAKKIDLSPDSNGHVNAAISTSLFDGFKGIYNVKIYAFDAVGNCAVGELNPETPINLYESNPRGKIVGTYSVVKDNVPVREAPYSKVNGKDTKVASISKDTKVAIIGIYVNDFENDWYQLDNGNWIYSENLKKVSAWNRYIERLNQIAQKGMYQFFWGQPIYSSNTSHGGGAAAFSADNGLVKAGQDYIYAAIDLITSSYRASNGSTGNSFVIEFNANGGSCYTRSKTVSEGASYGWLPTPSRYGYTFDGWFTDATAGEHVTESTVAISGGVLYAHWTRIILASGQCGDNLKYTLYGDGELCITGSGEMSSHPWTSNYAGRIADVNLPDGLTNICNNAFYQCTGIVAIEIPDTVTEIGSSAFDGCLNLTTVSGMKNVTNIESYAFYDCSKLENIVLPETLNSLGDAAFRNCVSLTKIKIPKALNSCGSNIFVGCNNLKTVEFEKGTTKIPNWLFGGYVSNESNYYVGLEKVDIPDTVTSIGNDAFRSCINLTTVTGMKNVTQIGDDAFYGCSKLENIVLPEALSKLGGFVFGDCSKLAIINLPKSLTTIGGDAFRNCVSLTKIKIPKALNSCGSNIFVGCNNLKTVEFEKGTTKIPNWLFGGYVSNESNYYVGLEKVDIPDTVTSIGNDAFRSCINLTTVTGMKNVTQIGDDAFYGCSKLENIVLPEALSKLGGFVFGDCSKLAIINLPKSLTTIGGDAFRNCVSLTKIKIPKALNSCGSNIFVGCNNLKTVEFEKGTTKIPNWLFGGYVSNESNYYVGLEKVDIPDTVTSIGNDAFRSCINLTTVTGMKNVTQIENDAFYGCSKLKNIELPLCLSNLGTNVFSYCTSLKSVTIPEGLTNIPSEMFMNCRSLTDIALPTTMKVIRSSAFEGSGLTNITLPYGCTEVQASAFKNSVGLISANIPDSVTSLGSSIFEGCSSLTDVNLGRNISSIPQNAFENCESLEKLVVPYYTTEIGNNAFTNDTAFTEITIPRNVTSISSTAFSYPDKLTIYGVPGTYAETYAGNNGIKFVGRESNAKEVKLNTSQITINKEDSYQLNMTVTPADYTDQIIWKSSDTSVATVSEKGLVKGIKGGTTTIKLTVGNVSTSCSVTVLQPVTSIYIDSNPTLGALETYQLSASVYPSDANNKTLIWTSSDTAVATVSNTGLVTAIGKGTATITATATDGSEVYDTCIVTVKNNLIICSEVDSMESEHNYFDNCSDIWQYTSEGAKALDITFDSRTYTESGFDYIYIMDKDNTVVGEYTGNELASHTVRVNGDTVKIKLVSDGSGTEWGFKVTKIAPVTSVHEMEFISTKEATCTDEGHNAYYHCKDCGKLFKDENGTIETTQQEVTIPALGHDWVYSQTVEPTYTDEGYTLYICSRCDETKKSDYTDKLILKYPELTSASNTTSGIQLKWSKVTDATGYILYRKTGNGSWSRIADIKNGSTVSYIDKTAKSGTTYTYTIRAYSGKYMSDWKTTKTIKRLDDPTVSATSNITAGVQVKWSKVTGATGYIVYRKNGSGSWSRVADIKSGSTVSYTDKTAKSGTTYTYTVRAYSGSTIGDWSSTKTVKRLADPTVSSASNITAGVQVKWAKTAGATGYIVYRKTGTGSWSRIATIKSGSTTSYTDKSAKSGTNYSYTVRAYNGSTMSDWHNSKAVKRLSNPAVTSASKTSNGINVKWSKVTGATGYVVYRKTAKGSWSRIANIKSGSTTRYTDTKASRGVTYTYTVRAYNGSTMSSFNSTKSAKR